MNDVRILSKDELTKKLTESRNELRALTFQVAAGQLKTVHKIHEIKILIARINTALRQIAT
ncbi:MAG: 50S ribosomal protein L29 [Candidatus Jacksonbacteria bacterium RIFCSPLOWO2_02_FULL_43_9]|nr:MAG: 50S ribosomal protein L29 [Candidatus Jacksonbacteria bacterium RIFCSPHIGHO2_02_FULL_43_10]OGY70498.1 MAG: 50S ribosomal protein L29 [Candidatus Jacksonbacteria bacterium RIFCSPLOWO2_01_FULL_44_13]OGY72822.1 MAG: 50S ribosomal protein L29 [Candidatus Jacksonbacteria bacterium RIFCSPLOWO2_02_FULL_43_9]